MQRRRIVIEAYLGLDRRRPSERGTCSIIEIQRRYISGVDRTGSGRIVCARLSWELVQSVDGDAMTFTLSLGRAEEGRVLRNQTLGVVVTTLWSFPSPLSSPN